MSQQSALVGPGGVVYGDSMCRDTTPGRDLLYLLELHRPPWMADAACREHPEIEFVPADSRSPTSEARAVCADCLCRDECLDYALADPHITGVWGGTTEAERHSLRRGRRAPVRLLRHGTVEMYRAELRDGQPTCADCRAANNEQHARFRRGLPGKDRQRSLGMPLSDPEHRCLT